MNRAIVLLALLLFYTCAFGQDPYYVAIDRTAGLPANTVYDVFQDSRGFVWFATNKGLCRYDGTIIKSFASKSQSLKSGSYIREDNYGRIWYENFDGVLYYVENEKLHQFEGSNSNGYFKYGIINNTLFQLRQNGVHIYDLKKLTLLKKYENLFENVAFTFSTKDSFCVMDDKIYCLDATGLKKTIALPSEFYKNFESPIIEGYKDGFIIFSKYATKYYVYQNNTFKSFDIPDNIGFIQNCAVYGEEVWVCTPNGVLKLNPEKNSMKHLFKDYSVSYVLKDRRNNYWVSTLSHGVFFVEDLTAQLYVTTSLPYSLAHDKSNIFIGTEKDEVLLFNPSTKLSKTLFRGNTNHVVNPLFVNGQDKSILFTSSKFHVLQNDNLIFQEKLAIKDMVRVDNNQLAFAATNNSGIITNNPYLPNVREKTKSSKTITLPIHFENTLTKSNGKAVAYNPSNKTIYYATNKGLFAQSQNVQKEILDNGASIFALNLELYKNAIFALLSDETIQIINTTNNVEDFVLPDELKALKIQKIKVLNQTLFLFTNDEVMAFNLENRHVKTALLMNKDVSINDVTTLDNKIYFSTSKGLLIKSNTLSQPDYTPKLIIHKVLVNDKTTDLSTSKKLHFEQNNIKISYSILSEKPNQKDALCYQINNSTWNRLEPSSRELNLLSLSPGTYTLTLKAGENSAKSKTVFSFTISKPFWETGIFLAFILAVALITSYFLYRVKLKSVNRNNQLRLDKVNLEKNLNKSKLKALKSQMNPHFFYNALNTLQSYVLANEKKEALVYLNKFSNLTRTMLDMSERESISIKEEVQALQNYLDIEKERFEDTFMYTITVHPELQDDFVKIPTLMLQPYVENAMKHGLLNKKGVKELHIKFSKINDKIQIIINDNGIGRAKSMILNESRKKNHKSFATKSLQDRVEIMNQDDNKEISIEFVDHIDINGHAQGTTVIIILKEIL